MSRTSSGDRINLARLGSEEDKVGVECLDYCAGLHLLAAVLSDGRCGILRTGTALPRLCLQAMACKSIVSCNDMGKCSLVLRLAGGGFWGRGRGG